jgi:hypothetical protein
MEKPRICGALREGLKELEPSTFCMASSTANGLATGFYLQIKTISALMTVRAMRSDARKFR